jgi:dihydroorotate dehydrogenase (fumarate)
MVKLNTKYLGLELKNPVVVSASPLSKKVERVQRLEAAGASAVVMYSLFEEQIRFESRELNHYLNRGTESFAEALSYFPEMENYNVGPDTYLDRISKLKKAVNIPVIGSLNGVSTGGWVDYAKKIEEAGADALELNIYYIPTEFETTSQVLEEAQVDLVSDVRKQLRIPFSVKLSPYFTALPNLAQKLVKAGADGLVLFNRFYQPDLNIENFEVEPSLVLSESNEMRLPLRWIAILYGRLNTSFAISSGVHTGKDVIKAVMAGADAAMMASELIAKGPERVSEILTEIEVWMQRKEYHSIDQMKGSMSQKAVANPAAFERANYMKVLNSYDVKFR